MKKRLIFLLIATIVLTLSGCNKEEVMIPITPDFELPDYREENESIDTDINIIKMIKKIAEGLSDNDYFNEIEYNELLHSSSLYSISAGISKDSVERYGATDNCREEGTMEALEFTYEIIDIIQQRSFTEGEDFNGLYDNTITYNIFVNDNYYEFHHYDGSEETHIFLYFDNDNLIYEHYEIDDSRITYYKYDWDTGYVKLHISDYEYRVLTYYALVDFNSKTSEFLAIEDRSVIRYYNFDQDEEYFLYFNIFEYGSKSLDISLYTDNYVDISYSEHIGDDSSYILEYNLMNIDGWDSYNNTNVSLEGVNVFSDAELYYVPNFIEPSLRYVLDDFTESDFALIEGGNYTGAYNYEILMDTRDSLYALLNNYSITNVDGITQYVLDGVSYENIDEILELFYTYLPDEYKQTDE